MYAVDESDDSFDTRLPSSSMKYFMSAVEGGLGSGRSMMSDRAGTKDCYSVSHSTPTLHKVTYAVNDNSISSQVRK